MDHPKAQSEHLDDVQLDALRTGEGDERQRLHLAQCAACQSQYGELLEIASAFATLKAIEVPVPAEIDRQILWRARKRALIARRRRGLQSPAFAAAAVAALLLIALASSVLQDDRGGMGSGSKIARADIDGNGTINIRDAFLVARAIDRGEALPPDWDVSGDGTVDRADADLIAADAVALRGAG